MDGAAGPTTVVERYTKWYCFLFAVAVHEFTGWRIVEVECDYHHFMCMTDEGPFFDVRGFADEALDSKGNGVGEFEFCTAEYILEGFADDIEHLPQARVDAKAVLGGSEWQGARRNDPGAPGATQWKIKHGTSTSTGQHESQKENYDGTYGTTKTGCITSEEHGR